MKIIKLRVGTDLVTNCYIVIKKKQAIIIDPGFDVLKIRTKIKELGVEVKAIILTHSHFDHICALNCFAVDVYLHVKELTRINTNEYNNLLKRIAKQNMRLDFDLQTIQYKTFTNNEVLKIANFKITTIFTPGHSLGHSALLIDNTLFSGDCVFFERVGKTTFDFGGDEIKQRMSVVTLLNQFKENYIIYPGHGKNTTIEHEKINNKYYLKYKKTIKVINGNIL